MEHNSPFPNIIMNREFRISHIFLRTEFQNQVIVVHASVISTSIFLRTKAVKQGSISGLID